MAPPDDGCATASETGTPPSSPSVSSEFSDYVPYARKAVDYSSDEEHTLDELVAKRLGNRLQFPTNVPSEVMASVEGRVQGLPWETPGCTFATTLPTQ